MHLEKDGVKINSEPMMVTWDAISAEKGGYRHFIFKEIHEQPQVIGDTFRGRADADKGDVYLEGVNFTDAEFKEVDRIVIVACGTAWHAGLVSKFYIEKLARVPVDVDYGSEFRYRSPIINNKTLFMAISQSRRNG